jgi:nicotinamidase/pyrazinamidase
LVVPFFSKHYTKPWCTIEWRTIFKLLLSRTDAVLPVRLDDTEILGWEDMEDFYIRRFRGKTPRTSKEIAQLILDKFKINQWKEKPKKPLPMPDGIPAAKSNGEAAEPTRRAPIEHDTNAVPIFISHHHSEVAFAREVKSKLRGFRSTNGHPLYSPWLAADDIAGGDEYAKEIDDAIRRARALIMIVSPKSMGSMYATYEWAYAFGRGIPVIPIRYGEAEMHPRLRVLQYLNFIDPAFQPWDALEKCLSLKLTGTKQMIPKPEVIEVLREEVHSAIESESSSLSARDSSLFVSDRTDMLLVIDIQRDFFENGALPVADAAKLIAPLNRAIRTAQERGMKLVFTRDWHPSNHRSFVNISHEGAWPRHCVQGTPGAEFHPRLTVPMDSMIVNIGTDNSRLGYSAFDDAALAQLMSSSEIGTVYIAGLALEYCVQATALEAAGKFGKRVVILESLVRAATKDRYRMNALWEYLGSQGVERQSELPSFAEAVAAT